jgi:hypothetical protein
MDKVLFNNIVNINDFVFSIIPCTKKPNNDIFIDRNLFEIMNLFIRNEAGTWCGSHAKFFTLFMNKIKIPSRVFSYGIKGYLTHAVSIVTIGDYEYLFDSYFNKYYAFNNEPLSFFDMMEMINSNSTDGIVSVYGNEKRMYESPIGWTYISGKQYEEMVVKNHMTGEFKKKLYKKFKSINLFNLLKVNW